MNLLAGDGNGLFFLPTAGKRASISINYTPGLLGWLYRAQLRMASQTNGAAGVYRGLNQCTQ